MGSNMKYRKFRLTVPERDEEVIAWVREQASLSQSLRVLIHEYVSRNGLADPTCMPIPRGKGRPPKAVAASAAVSKKEEKREPIASKSGSQMVHDSHDSNADKKDMLEQSVVQSQPVSEPKVVSDVTANGPRSADSPVDNTAQMMPTNGPQMAQPVVSESDAKESSNTSTQQTMNGSQVVHEQAVRPAPAQPISEPNVVFNVTQNGPHPADLQTASATKTVPTNGPHVTQAVANKGATNGQPNVSVQRAVNGPQTIHEQAVRPASTQPISGNKSAVNGSQMVHASATGSAVRQPVPGNNGAGNGSSRVVQSGPGTTRTAPTNGPLPHQNAVR